jgi:hypothetical protein
MQVIRRSLFILFLLPQMRITKKITQFSILNKKISSSFDTHL